MGSKAELMEFFRNYQFDQDGDWLAHKRSMPAVPNNTQAEDRIKALYIRDNMIPDFNPDWVATAAAVAAAAAGPSNSPRPNTPLSTVTYNDSSPWRVQKRAALQLRMAHGTIITTSFTDGQPLAGWVPAHAVREMWQNLRDGVTSQFGGVLKPARSPTHLGRFHVMSVAAGRVVAHVDGTDPNLLRLVQQEVVLLPKHLQLASFKDARSAGCHGEGFKLGINLLLRKGHTVTYAMPGQVWTYYMSNMYDANLQNMSIRLDHGPDRDDMEICISGPGASALFEPTMDWELTDALLGRDCDMFTSSKGTVGLATDSTAWGRVYSRNLFVDSDETMKILQLALNVQKQQPRDRHVLQSGLNEELAGMLVACLAEGGSGNQSTPLFLHLLDRLREGKSNTRVRQAAGALREGMRAFHAKQLNIQKEIIIYMDEAGDMRVLNILGQLGKYVIDNTGALGDTIDLHQLTMTLIMSCPAYVPTDPDEIRNHKALTEYAKGLSMNSGHDNWSVKLSVRNTNVTGFCRLGNNGMMYMTCDLLRNSRFKAAVTDMHVNVMRYVKGDTMILSDMLGNFLADPFAFKPIKLAAGQNSYGPVPPVPPSGNSGGSSGGAGGASGSGSSGGAAPAVPTPAASLAKAFDAMNLHAEVPSSGVKKCDFRSMPSKFPPFPNDAKSLDHAACFGPEGLELTPVKVGQETLHVDKRLVNEARFRQLVSGAEARVAEMANMVRAMVASVAEALEMQTSDIPIMFVVCNDVLGFTQSGGVYLNLAPALQERDLAKAQHSLFMTLLHELTHRTHKPHDTHFASELAKLVYACKFCLFT